MVNESFIKIAKEASRLLNDSYDNCESEYDFTRWSQAELIEYAKDALLVLSNLLPKKFAKAETIVLQKGKVQQLEDPNCSVLKIIGKDGGVTSSIATAVSERLEGMFPSGCLESLAPEDYEVKSFAIEETAENIFYVSPPAPVAGIEVLAILSCPPDFDSKDYVIPLWAHNFVIEWMLYRAYSSEDESTQSVNNADYHLKHFYQMISNYVQAIEFLRDKRSIARTGEAQ